jgi:uncharacterized protein (TIGR02597 family)
MKKIVASSEQYRKNDKRASLRTTPNHQPVPAEPTQPKTIPMKASSSKFRALAVPFTLLAAALAQSAFAQTTATTTPVGFITTTLPAATTSPGYAAISVPLYNTPDFTGAVATIDTATAFSLTGASLPTFTAAAPRLARVKASVTASHVGKFLLVSSNTATQLTVTVPAGKVLGDYVSSGDSVEVVPANTFGTFFGANPASATSVFPPGSFFKVDLSGLNDSTQADNLLIWSGTSWLTYYNNNSTWRRNGSGVSRNNDILYPDEGIFIVRRGTTSLALTLMGTVPSTGEQTDIRGSGSEFFANRFPVDMQLGVAAAGAGGTVGPGGLPVIGLENSAGWVKNDDVNQADRVFIWNTAGPTPAWQQFYFHNTNNRWQRAGSGVSQNAKVVPAGTAVFITKTSAAATFAQSLPYTP